MSHEQKMMRINDLECQVKELTEILMDCRGLKDILDYHNQIKDIQDEIKKLKEN